MTGRDEDQSIRRELRLAQAPLHERSETERPDCVNGGIGSDGNQVEGAIQMVALVEAEIEVLPRLGLIRERR